MFGKLRQILENGKNLDLNKILLELWQDPFVQDFIIELNTLEQLRFGKLANGGELPRTSPTYLAAKRAAIGFSLAPTDKITLRLTGEFWDTFNVFGDLRGFVIDAQTQIHGKDFIQLYGSDILGLNDENRQKLVNFLIPLVQEKVREQIFLGVD